MPFSWVCKSILLIVIFPEPHTLPDLWCALESRVFYFFGSIFFFKKIPIEKFAFMQMVFIFLPQLVYTLPFHVTCFYIAFLHQLPLGSVPHDALVNNSADTHTDNTQTLLVHCSAMALLLPPSCQCQGHLSIVMTNVYLYLFINHVFLPLGSFLQGW